MLVLIATMLAAAMQPTASSLAGLYEIDQMEMGGGLELRADGQFRYALEYGAVSEAGEGKWRFDGQSVRLTSDPMPKSPDFELVSDEPAPKEQLTVRLAEPFQGLSGPVEAYGVPLDGAQPFELDLDENGRSATPSTKLKAIIPRVPVYGGLGSQIPLSADRGHRLVLRFVPNDLGKARFEDEKLEIGGDGLAFYRYDEKIVFRPAPK